jgi:hypothetical protein
MQLRPFALLATLALVTCGGAGDIKPKSGTWTYDGSMLVMSTCGDDPPVYAEGNFTLTDNGGSFTVDDGTYPAFTCSYEGGSYACAERVIETIEDLPIDATITFNGSVDGDLDSATTLSGVHTVEVTCAGSSCSTAAELANIDALPCEYTFSFTASTK